MNEKEIRAKLWADLKDLRYQIKEKPDCVGVALVRAKAKAKYISELLDAIK